MIHLTSHQLGAVAWAVDRLQAGASCIAIRGLAGTGKSTLVGTLRRLLQAHGFPTVLGTPTNRAALVVRQKGEKDAATIHSLCLMPYFDEPYTQAKMFLDTLPDTTPSTGALPGLLQEAFYNGPQALFSGEASASTPASTDLRTTFLGALQRTMRQYGTEKALRTVGILAEEHFAGFGPRQPQPEVLLIDEASMVSAEDLVKVQQVYRQVILIGDPGQLPPVCGTPILETTEGTMLTEIHRQAEDSPLIQLAHAVRAGEMLTKARLSTQTSGVVWAQSLPAAQCVTMPLLVWRNLTRVECTLQIRARLGYVPDVLAVGEPLICRVNARAPHAVRIQGKILSATKLDGSVSLEPFCNNGCYHVTAVHGPRTVTLQDDLTGDIYPQVQVHMEELDGVREAPETTRVRFGYALTAHTAQGGEWPVVAVSVPELKALSACRRMTKEDKDRWRYTALTRAKAHIIFLGEHCFT